MAIKLEIDPETGDVDVAPPEDTRKYYECLVANCEHAQPGYICGFDNNSVWNHYRISGFCPAMKWYRETRVKGFCIEERERQRKKSKYSFVHKEVQDE